MANTIYDNFYLSNEIENQYNSMLNLQSFCTIDNSLVGVAGMTRKINTYEATDGVEKLAVTKGNTKSIEVSYTAKDYEIALAQGRFLYYDEEAMTDPYAINVGTRHIAVNMFNTVNTDIYAEFNKATQTTTPTTLDFGAFVDAAALLNVETLESTNLFAFVNAADTATLRKSLQDDLKYVEGYVRTGYVGTVAGINIYAKKDAVTGTIIVASSDAVTLFNKPGITAEQERDANTRGTYVYGRKYYVAALTDATKAVKMTVTAPTP